MKKMNFLFLAVTFISMAVSPTANASMTDVVKQKLEALYGSLKKRGVTVKNRAVAFNNSGGTAAVSGALVLVLAMVVRHERKKSFEDHKAKAAEITKLENDKAGLLSDLAQASQTTTEVAKRSSQLGAENFAQAHAGTIRMGQSSKEMRDENTRLKNLISQAIELLKKRSAFNNKPQEALTLLEKANKSEEVPGVSPQYLELIEQGLSNKRST